MKRFLILSLFLGLLFNTPGAQARTAYADKQVAGWIVYSAGGYCWMRKKYPDGTFLKYNWSASEEASYLLLVNKKWNWITSDTRYHPKITVGDWSATVNAGGYKRNDGTYSIGFFADDALGFRDLIEHGKAVQIDLDSRIAGDYPLAGSRFALAELYNCHVALMDAASKTKNGRQEYD